MKFLHVIYQLSLFCKRDILFICDKRDIFVREEYFHGIRFGKNIILGFLYNRIANYIDSGSGPCEVYPAPFAVKLFDNRDDTVEPDISVICDPGRLTDQGCSGAPDWIIEITSPGNSAHDYVRKLNLYIGAGVREYWIVNPEKKKVVVYHLEDSDFDMDAYTFEDRVKVHIYDDFGIDFKELNL